MPTYRNDTRATIAVQNTEWIIVPVLPGESIETFEILPLSQTAATPTNEITIDSDAGADVFTSPVKPNSDGYLNISISGETSGSVVTLQRSFDGGATWKNMWGTGVMANKIEESLIDKSKGVLYRIGVKNGDYSSGSVTVRLG
jgi:hypothetical protein